MEFTYNASALGAGGVVRINDVETVIPSIASVTLSPTGGAGESRIENYYSEAVSFKLAHTKVSGAKVGGVYTTQTYVYMTELRVFDWLKIEALRGVVTSRQSNLQHDDHEITLEVSYSGVSTAGPDVDLGIDECVRSLKCYDDLDAVIGATTGAQAKRVSPGVTLPGHPTDLVPQFGAQTLETLRTHVVARRALRGSVVKRADAALTHRHHDLPIPGKGTVRFGELMFKPGRRRVNLLRIALGNDTFEESLNERAAGADGGFLTIASVEGNGTPVYP